MQIVVSLSIKVQPVDLTNCDREPIHIPGAILPHGVMLVLDGESLEILQAAGDTPGLIGVDVRDLPGQNAGSLLAAEQLSNLRKLFSDPALNKPRHFLDPQLRPIAGKALDASVHVSDGQLVIEFEAADKQERYASDPLAAVQYMISGLENAPSLSGYCQIAANLVREIIGFDRVMVYRFMEDDSGWVIAESRVPQLSPFLDLHYPAGDIPKQARALYLKSWLRQIVQVDYDPAPLTPPNNPRSGRTLDMSFATLRDVSLIHREYLRNMGVNASMSISIVVEGKLWGLIACHHYTPRRLPRHLRAVCEIFGSIFSLQLEARERADLFNARSVSRRMLQEIMRNLAHEDSYADGLINQSPNLLDYITEGSETQKGGVAVRVDGHISSKGTTPSHAQINALLDWLSGNMAQNEGVFATDCLGEVWEPAKDFADAASGILAIWISRQPMDFVVWFRPEIVKTVKWGGDPTKPVELGPNGDRLTPRKSFDIWQQIVRGRSEPWSPHDKDAAADLKIALLEIVLRRIDATVRERLRAQEHERLLMAELDHRVKNTLANIQALVSHTSRSATSLAAFTQGLEKRLHSMSKAHSLLTEGRWEGASIESLLREELAAYASSAITMDLDDPTILLVPKSALALSLAVHELTTNAAKYGALSKSGGRLEVRWRHVEDGGATLTWRETGGPPVQPPARRGFGSTLLERALALDTGGTAVLHFNP